MNTASKRTGLWISGAAAVLLLGSTVPALAQGGAAPAAAPAKAKAVAAAKAKAVAAAPAARPTASFPEAAALRRLVKGLGQESHGKVEVTQEDDLRQVSALVTTKEGAFTIGASVDDDPAGVAGWTESCRLDADGVDGRICTPLVERRTLGVWDRTYPEQAGRRSLTAAATTKAGGTLTLVVDNWTIVGDEKVAGPSWKRAGITVAEVRKALAGTGLTVR